MKDPLGALEAEREQTLLREIRKELKISKQYRVVVGIAGLLLMLFIGYGYATGKFGIRNVNWLWIVFAATAFAAARIPQRDRLLHQAAEKLAEKDK